MCNRASFNRLIIYSIVLMLHVWTVIHFIEHGSLDTGSEQFTSQCQKLHK